MEQRIKICRKCHDELAESGTILLQWYIEICTCVSAGFPPVISDGKEGKGDTLTHYLESKGFVCTTEINMDRLLVRPIGHFEHLGVDVFCKDVDSHGASD